MTLFLPESEPLKQRLLTDQPLVVCFCAAWCDTCGIYRGKVATLAETLGDTIFVWADIEDYPELLGDEDVEDFPTILIEAREQVQFFGAMLPHINQLERLLESLAAEPNIAPVSTQLPDVRKRLLSLAR
jgi:thioredoxin-like negative regulator of GroEL